MEKIRFEIPLNPVTKKNSQRIVKVGKYFKILPSKAYERYEKECAKFMPKTEKPIGFKINLKATYFMKTRRIVDLVNLHEALCDILVKYGIIIDDNSKIIGSMDGSKVAFDKENPRTEVEITRV